MIVPRWFLALAAVFWIAPLQAEETWPGWRGPRGDGTSLDGGVPLKWSIEEDLVWKVRIPGKGHASPIVWKDRLFLVTSVEEERKLLCLDRTSGRELWSRTVLEAPLEGVHRRNSHASSTPATDGKRVYVSFLDRDRMYDAAYDFSGAKQWEVRPGGFSSIHGYCSSPVLLNGKVIFNGDHDGEAYLVALDGRSGRTVW